jgi:hypothetical protein
VKVRVDIHKRLLLHSNLLGQLVGELATMYLYEAMRIVERAPPRAAIPKRELAGTRERVCVWTTTVTALDKKK